jgi:hypothetical protein
MQNKVCNKCNIAKDLTDFYKQSNGKLGVRSYCKLCVIKNRKDDSINIAKQRKRFRTNNRERLSLDRSSYYKANKKVICEKSNQYKKDNKGITNASNGKRRANKLLATPKWLTDFDITYIKSIYMQGSFLEMHVDHIVPLQGKNVCGLHVPWNLQLLEPEENLKKSNKF